MPDRAKSIRIPARKGKGAMPRIRPVGQAWSPFEDIFHAVVSMSWTWFFVLVCGMFLALNTFFALLYMAQHGAISGAAPTFENMFFFSVQTLATIGYGGMAPATRYGHIVVAIEALFGIVNVALITGITFTKFARPTARILFSEKMVVGKRDGVPHLMVRMANWRHNQVVEAQLRIILLVSARTLEGETMRKPIELSLVRDRNALFGLSWTAMHVIDEKSPLFGADALDKLRKMSAEFFVALSGTDETISQTIHARYSYALDDVVWNARFADVLTVLPDGTRELDYTKFHDVEMLEEAS